MFVKLVVSANGVGKNDRQEVPVEMITQKCG